ncbi:MAG: hypothetical protein RL519_1848 [Pseudomonadota bacterium]
MYRIAMALAMIMPLVACGQEPAKQPAKEAAGEADHPPPVLPGQYRVDLRINRVEFPGMTGPMADKAKTMFGTSAQTSEYCLTTADAGTGREDYYRRTLAKGDCKYEKLKLTGKSIDAVLVCQTGQGMTARNEVAGTFTATGSNIAVKSTSQIAGGSVKMEAEVRSERIGDCT